MTDRLDDLTRPGELDRETWNDEADLQTEGAEDTGTGGGIMSQGATATDLGVSDDEPIMRDRSDQEEPVDEGPAADPTVLKLHDRQTGGMGMG
jgi:hypothetical protein